MKLGWSSGAAVTPSRSFSSGSSATVAFDSSLALGAEYDRRLLPGRRASVYGGVDFLASPLDVKLSNPPSDVFRLAGLQSASSRELAKQCGVHWRFAD
jgi:hypothetical protein